MAKPDPVGITFQAGEQTLLRYRFGNVPFKPYIELFQSPAGVNVLLDGPPDHLHHHGLMYALAVDGVDFWGETAEAGRQSPRYLQILSPTSLKGWWRTGLVQTLDWNGPQAKGTLLKEKRVVEVWRGPDLDASLISWQSELHTPPGRPSVELSGRAYFGLGMRFIRSMDNTGHFFNADKGQDVAGTNDTRSRWCAYAAVADGFPVTVAVFDHPDNPRSPANWFTMNTPFAYVTATAGLHHEPLALTKESPLQFRFGVAIWDGHVKPNQIQSLYRKWISLPTAK